MDDWYAVHHQQEGFVINGPHEEPAPPPAPAPAQWVAAERLDRPDLVPPDRGTDLVTNPLDPEAESAGDAGFAAPDGDYGYDYVDGTIQAAPPRAWFPPYS